jgi:hypothetical protein
VNPVDAKTHTTGTLPRNLDLGLNERIFIGHWIGRPWDAARSVIEMKIAADRFGSPETFTFK